MEFHAATACCTSSGIAFGSSFFMGFAPMNNPKIAIAVYVENGGFGATYGVPIGALMMEQYMKGKLSPENEIRAEEISNRVILYGNEER